MQTLSLTKALANLNRILEDVCARREPVAITRASGQHVVLISLAEFERMQETLYLLGSAKNAQRLMESVAQIESDRTSRLGR
ncbi:type II toxin-antitoxin system Phd/YefM family antitoxin [Amantichitinum ursilacus]|uniref:Antitoxin n=1 Tax=Amantichitinum ursilacus TaxID=857265 RepID=A0A0N1JRZ7_9NEIS|nr:type II toxin-antitoxin system prevent-host-death family antitoxin [Amantichitinum ursilacus]KPC50461.1 Antitoxin YefM [Amantichitinum ursilacus]